MTIVGTGDYENFQLPEHVHYVLNQDFSCLTSGTLRRCWRYCWSWHAGLMAGGTRAAGVTADREDLGTAVAMGGGMIPIAMTTNTTVAEGLTSEIGWMDLASTLTSAVIKLKLGKDLVLV